MNKLNYILLAIVCISCSTPNNNGNKEDSGELNETFLIDLKENLDYLGAVKDIIFISDSSFAVIAHNPMRLYLYDSNGTQTKMVKGAADGKNDFSSPEVIRFYDEHLYLWCSDKHRFFVYDKIGNFLKSIKGPSYAIGDFVIKDDKAYCYVNGGFDYWISIYDLDTRTTLKELGTTSYEQELLNVNSYAGGMTLFSKDVFVSSSDALRINAIRSNFELSQATEISDKDFKVDSVTTDPHQIISYDKEQMIDYVLKNSYVNGLYSISDTLVLKAEIGYMVRNEKNAINNNNRFVKYYLFNKNFEFLKSYKTPHNFNSGSLLFSGDNHLFSVKMIEGDDNFIYKIYKMQFN